MRKIITTTFVTMDGVMQAPGGPEEDTSGGSHKPFEPDWVNRKVISGDVPAALRKLKAEDGPDMIVWGSGTLIQTLLTEKLVDRMHVWTHPVTIGSGKRLFADGTRSATWKLVKSRVGASGVIIATYERAGELVTGTIGA
jgi:dihydrofolate reductase